MECEDHFSNKDFFDVSNAKRKTESLFSVMTKRNRRHDDECMIVDDDCCCSGSDTELSVSSDFDIISLHVLHDMDLMGEVTGSKSLSVCKVRCPNEENGGTLVNKLSLGEVNDENSVRSLEDEVFVSPKEFQHIIDPQVSSGHRNDIIKNGTKDEVSYIPDLNEPILRCSVNKEDPEITFNANRSSASEVKCGDLVDMQESMEKMSNNDELSLSNKDAEPIPICIVPPDGESSILLENGSVHRIVSCRNEFNLYDDHTGLEITPIPLTKRLEGPSRPWSVCGSLATDRNLPLVEGKSGACSSMDEQLDVNVNTEDRDAAQKPSTLYQDKDDSEDEICFSDIDAMIRKLNLVPDDFDLCSDREEWNMSKHPRHTLIGSKHCTRTSMRRAVMFHGAIAVLHCPESQHFIRKEEVIIGRSSNNMRVDIDLGKDGYGSKISRRQALVKLEKNGTLSLKNLGKRHILVNGEKLETGQIATLMSCSSIKIRGIVFVLKINKEAVRQFSKNNTRRNSKDDTKFRWCE